MGKSIPDILFFFFFIVVSASMAFVSCAEAVIVEPDGSFEIGQSESNCYNFGSVSREYFTNPHCKKASDMELECIESCFGSKSSENPLKCTDICGAECAIALSKNPEYIQEGILCLNGEPEKQIECPPHSTPINKNGCPDEKMITKDCCCDPGFSKWYNSCISDDEIPGKVICGKWGCQEGEDCVRCPADCGCTPPEVCDPFSPYANPDTKCSPPAVVLLISEDMSMYEFGWVFPRLKPIMEEYEKKGYYAIFKRVNGIDEVSEYLANPSTRILIYGGHACDPSIEFAVADKVRQSIYGMGVRKWRSFGFNATLAQQYANDRSNSPNLEVAYIFACDSLNDNSLADYLVQPGGRYYGHRGTLDGYEWLEEYVRPR